MAEQEQKQEQEQEQQHHHHHHHHGHHGHRRDSATRFKEKSLHRMEFWKKFEKYLKCFLLLLAILMAMAVIFVYRFA